MRRVWQASKSAVTLREDALRRGDAGHRHAYSNEHEGAFRIDSDTNWVGELCAGADAVFEAFAAAGERACLSAFDVNFPDSVVLIVLRYIGRGAGTLIEEQAGDTEWRSGR